MNKINDLVTVHRPGFALQKMSTKIVAINEKGVWHKPAASKAVAILVNKNSSSGIGWDYYIMFIGCGKHKLMNIRKSDLCYV